MSDPNANKETKTDKLINLFKNNRIVASVILVFFVIISSDKIISAFDNISRFTGLKRSYDVNQESERGRFSSSLLENAWNRMFWMRVYTERVRVGASKDEQMVAWQKYIDATEKWSSNIMNYLLGLDQYYPGSNKREFLEDTIQPKFIEIGKMIREIKYPKDTLLSNLGPTIDSAQGKIDDVNNDFYNLIDQPLIHSR